MTTQGLWWLRTGSGQIVERFGAGVRVELLVGGDAAQSLGAKRWVDFGQS
ncbi:MAG TPA: hypothetical protein VFN61_12895 [Acidimicrobiales bacterium]|nr:hypothetical protein [Acidimicrobiales bacterium]